MLNLDITTEILLILQLILTFLLFHFRGLITI